MRRRASLAVRITSVCLAVAGVAVVVAGLVAAGLVWRTAQDVLQRSLAAQADVVASQVDATGAGSRIGLAKVADVVRGQGIMVVTARGRGLLQGDDRAERAATAAGLGTVGPGQSRSSVQDAGGQELLVEVRGVSPQGSGFALVQPVRAARDMQRGAIRTILLSLGAGLLAAGVAGLVFGRLLARPLLRTAGAAAAMRRGRRDVRVPVEGPAEVAEVAGAVNELADALRRSESRQRDFLLSVSHELRTPLTAIHGFAESLADGVVEGPNARRAGATIQAESSRLQRLVDDLLDLARLGADEFQLDLTALDLTDTVRRSADVWRNRCERTGVAFRAELPSHAVTVRADPSRLRQVIDGLAENALRVTPPGSPMVFALGATANGTTLQVRDGGPGLQPEDYPRAFERGFLNAKYRGSRPVGSGVGLALAHGLVTRMGATLTAGPAPEGGAAFTITFRH